MLIKTYRLRLYVLYIVPVVLMVGLVLRLYWLQVVNRQFYEDFAKEQHYREHTITPTRGKIYDANGHELAGSVILDAVYMELMTLPDNFRITQEGVLREMAHEITEALKDLPDSPKLSFDDVFNKMKTKKHVLLTRGVDEQHKYALMEIQQKYRKYGVQNTFFSFEPENKRRYSRADLAPHIVGYTQRDTTGDNTGVDGVEKIYNDELRGKTEKYITQKSATGKPMEPADPNLLESTFGHSVKLTIDESLQAVTQNVLQQGVDNSHADSGVAICYHVKTGEILAMANYPTYSLNNVGIAGGAKRRNRALTDPIEPGSVMKIITFASLFDAKEIEPYDMIDCENGSWIMPNGRPIKDSHADGVVPVSQVFQYSSNIGTIKAARAFDNKTFYRYLNENFGFGKKTGVDLPAESSGVLRHYKQWSGMSMSSLPMGYEIQVTAVQVAAAVGAIANKGQYMRPHVVKEILDHHGNTVERVEPEYIRQVADPVACRKIIDLMELVVEKGTAKAAKLDGYRVGGKTGTTKKVMKGGGYGKAYIASFCGVAPIEDPEVCIYVYVDNPRGGQFYGGQIAAPVFREIAREAMRVLRIPEQRNQVPAQDIQVVLDKVRNKIDGRAPMELLSDFQSDSDEEVSPGVVPDLKGMTLAEAAKKAAMSGLGVIPRGSGVVVDQEPGAFESIESTKEIKIRLTNTRQSIRRMVDHYNSVMKVDEEERAAETVASVEPFQSTVSLNLDLGGDTIPVPVEQGPDASWGVAESVPQKPANPEPTPFPDLDEFAKKPVDPKASKQLWDSFNKEMEELEKAEASRETAKASEDSDEEESDKPAKASSLPVPEIDGTEDLDPTRHEINPIKIKTPERTPRARPAAESLYNM